ncbi:MAG: CoA transferase [Crocinitomicaceae bacterium]|nr:CoA transferase [Crocinitomicaceae bacterium]
MLSKLKIIDASSVLAGPSVGTYFAELGAKVIKVEHPKYADVTRTWKLPSEDSDAQVSAYFSSINYKKEYITLDLKDKDDHAKFMKLIIDADVLITNFKCGDDVKLNIEDKDLLATNPKLIIGKINGYGKNNERVAYDLILQAETGFMSMNGTPNSGPVKMPIAMIDILAAHHLKEAILLALLERTNTGKGKSVSVSLYDAALSSLANQGSNYLMGNHIPQRIGSLHPNIAPYGELFETSNNDLITFAIGSNTHFEKLCKTLKIEDLLLDKRFQQNQDRVINRTELQKIIQEKIKTRSTNELLSKLKSLHVPVGKVKNLAEVFEDQKAKELVRTEIIDGVETSRVTSVVFK